MVTDRLEDDPAYDDVLPRSYRSDADLRANDLRPRLRPELVEHATEAQARAVELHREAATLEQEAELCFAAIKELQS